VRPNVPPCRLVFASFRAVSACAGNAAGDEKIEVEIHRTLTAREATEIQCADSKNGREITKISNTISNECQHNLVSQRSH